MGQPEGTGKTMSPKKRWLDRADASGMLEEDVQSPELTDPRSFSNVLEEQAATSSHAQATTSSNSEDSESADQSDSSSGRPKRDRKLPDRYGKYVVHVVEGQNLEVENASIERSNAQAASDIPQSHAKKKTKRQDKEGGEERPSKKYKKSKKTDSH